MTLRWRKQSLLTSFRAYVTLSYVISKIEEAGEPEISLMNCMFVFSGFNRQLFANCMVTVRIPSTGKFHFRGGNYTNVVYERILLIISCDNDSHLMLGEKITSDLSAPSALVWILDRGTFMSNSCDIPIFSTV